jgi:hypothetical protein
VLAAGPAQPQVPHEAPPALVPVGRPPSIGPAMDDIAAQVEDQQLQQQQLHQQNQQRPARDVETEDGAGC